MQRTSHQPDNEQSVPSVVSHDHAGSDTDTGSGGYVQAWDRHAARAQAASGRRRLLRVIREGAQTAVLALVLFLGARSVAHGWEVRGPSMQPTYHTGQRIFVAKYLFHGPRRGDVVVFEAPFAGRDDLIKRVIGVPGDHVLIKDGRVWVNGELLDERYLRGVATFCSGRWCDITLGPDEYYVMGDNRPNSGDSRLWGPLNGDAIAGKAWLVYYPFTDFGPVR